MVTIPVTLPQFHTHQTCLAPLSLGIWPSSLLRDIRCPNCQYIYIFRFRLKFVALRPARWHGPRKRLDGAAPADPLSHDISPNVWDRTQFVEFDRAMFHVVSNVISRHIPFRSGRLCAVLGGSMSILPSHMLRNSNVDDHHTTSARQANTRNRRVCFSIILLYPIPLDSLLQLTYPTRNWARPHRKNVL